ncbi:unnamed protein product [[Actinomadura] parvosata subsp. kistnae]|nr:unnamed protein product [Actinomadura parvosata subsp. kistnae]
MNAELCAIGHGALRSPPPAAAVLRRQDDRRARAPRAESGTALGISLGNRPLTGETTKRMLGRMSGSTTTGPHPQGPPAAPSCAAPPSPAARWSRAPHWAARPSAPTPPTPPSLTPSTTSWSSAPAPPG